MQSGPVYETLLRTVGVDKHYGNGDGATFVAVDEVDLDVQRSEFVTLVGPSGCGKTTLLKILAGLVPPTHGEVLFAGSAGGIPPGRYGIVFQTAALLPWRTVLENVLLPTQVLGRPTSPDRERALSLLESVGLADFRNGYPNQLSGGMQQRAAIARALVHEPDVLLMDEPFAALDALTREEMGVQLQEMHVQQLKTVVFVTHSISEALLLSDRVLVMAGSPGSVVAEFRVDLPRPRAPEDVNVPAVRDIEKEIRAGMGISRRSAEHRELQGA